jgi:hypothetical protein
MDVHKSADIRRVHAQLRPKSTAAHNVKLYPKCLTSIVAVDIRTAKAEHTRQADMSSQLRHGSIATGRFSLAT